MSLAIAGGRSPFRGQDAPCTHVTRDATKNLELSASNSCATRSTCPCCQVKYSATTLSVRAIVSSNTSIIGS
jgi:hypothetical protein